MISTNGQTIEHAVAGNLREHTVFPVNPESRKSQFFPVFVMSPLQVASYIMIISVDASHTSELLKVTV